MKVINQHNLIFVGIRSGQPVIHWPGVALGYVVFLAAIFLAGTLGWYFLSLAAGADFIQGLGAVTATSFSSAGAVIAVIVSRSISRPSSKMAALD